MCVAPAYQRWLPDVNAALAPVLSEVAGLTGAPVRATQIAAADAGGHGGPPSVVSLGGQPPVIRLLLGNLNMPGPCGSCAGPVVLSEFNGQVRLSFVQAFIGVNQVSDHGSPVQLAVQAALLQGAGIPIAAQPRLITEVRDGPGPSPGPATGPVYAAARRFAALSASARQSWLAAHLAAVRAGRLSLKDLP